MKQIITILAVLISGKTMAFGGFNMPSFNTSGPSTKSSNKNIPSWVQDIKDGGGLRVNTGSGKTLFRNISTGSGSKNKVCTISKRENKANIKEILPFPRIPSLTVEHVFFNKEEGYCATTYSIKTRILNKLEEIALDRMIKGLDKPVVKRVVRTKVIYKTIIVKETVKKAKKKSSWGSIPTGFGGF